MAIEVTVGPPQITINRCSFVLSEPDGSVTVYTDQGFYSTGSVIGMEEVNQK